MYVNITNLNSSLARWHSAAHSRKKLADRRNDMPRCSSERLATFSLVVGWDIRKQMIHVTDKRQREWVSEGSDKTPRRKFCGKTWLRLCVAYRFATSHQLVWCADNIHRAMRIHVSAIFRKQSCTWRKVDRYGSDDDVIALSRTWKQRLLSFYVQQLNCKYCFNVKVASRSVLSFFVFSKHSLFSSFFESAIIFLLESVHKFFLTRSRTQLETSWKLLSARQRRALRGVESETGPRSNCK